MNEHTFCGDMAKVGAPIIIGQLLPDSDLDDLSLVASRRETLRQVNKWANGLRYAPSPNANLRFYSTPHFQFRY
jgi:hypothetical protein